MTKFKPPMLCVKLNQKLVILFLFAFLFSAGFFQQTSLADDKDVQLAKLEERLNKFEKTQQTILEKQDEIIELIKQLKVWVRRN